LRRAAALVREARARTMAAADAREWFWSTSDLPQARLHELVDTPFVLRLTCKAMRDAHHKGAEWRPRWPGTIVVYWSGKVVGFKTKSWVGDMATSVSRVAWAHDAKLVRLDTLVRCAAAAGALPSLEWLHRHANYSWPNDYDACHSAAKHGHLNTLKWLVRTARAQWMPNVVVDAAAKNGHLDCLKWAMHHGCENPRHLLPEVARNGHTDVVEFLWIHNASGHVMEAVEEAAGQGHMDVLKMFHRHNLRWGREPKERAAACGQLEALQFLVKYDLTLPSNVQELHHENGWMEACLWHAAKEGHVHVLEWLVGFGREIDVHMCVFAARKGRINVLEWILDRGHRDLLLEPDVLQCAQHFDQTDVVAWLRQLRRA